ncbi:hypothetical protein MVEN_00915200 [Mycena venus]|uniref:DUF6533 domain-containing protein n=1 Tax=Mycena venus TaxID=2733690 RepID=A0A8H6YCK7_9AGAR|nr:hypothetical protein MVEN_00915200 [Mycena venus]
MSHSSIDFVDEAPLLDPTTFTWDLRLYRSVVLAGFVLLIYDHTLTLATEVKFIWAAKLRPSIYWFLALRYIGLVANIANCVLYFAELSHEVRVPLFSLVQALNDLFSEVCVKMQIMWKVLVVSQEILVECTLIMRVFAMYGRNWRILICLLAVFAPCPGLALWDAIKQGEPQIFSGPGLSGCATVTPRTSTFRLAGAWESQIVCDILVLLLTIRRAYVQRDMYPRYAGTLMWQMTTDGAGYFCIIIIANIANLTTFYLGDIFLRGFLTWFITSLSITLLARLMLNLHEAAAVGMTSGEPSIIELETLRFATVQMTVDNGA